SPDVPWLVGTGQAVAGGPFTGDNEQLGPGRFRGQSVGRCRESGLGGPAGPGRRSTAPGWWLVVARACSGAGQPAARVRLNAIAASSQASSRPPTPRAGAP